MFVILSGFVNILKHSARLFLLVIDRSNIISPFVLQVAFFLSLYLLVRDRVLCLSPGIRGLNLGKISWILVWASRAQACGSRHPSILSLMQSMQTHCGDCSWSELFLLVCIKI